MNFADTIRKKRDGGSLSDEELEFFASGLADDSLPAEQIAALAMAVYFASMSAAETTTLTRAMAGSGTVLDWSGAGLDGPVLDKHSTGGVGDKVSFLLAPILAECGAYVPMISGRALGHSGGTLDKLDSIPGYDSVPTLERFRAVVADCGAAIIGQTAQLAPADRRLYAIRDVTATVESIPLITASILSKKLAAGLGALVMDVKWGTGAFMRDLDKARALARSLIDTAAGADLPVTAIVSDMNQPLGLTAGNALEIAESVGFLTGDRREPRLDEITRALCAEVLCLAGLATDRDAAHRDVARALDSGGAAERFARMLAALGAPGDFIESMPRYLPAAPIVTDVPAPRAGFVTAYDTRAIGLAITGLGGGRLRADDRIDPTVGFSDIVAVGTRLAAGEPLARVHAANRAAADTAIEACIAATTLDDVRPTTAPTVTEVLR